MCGEQLSSTWEAEKTTWSLSNQSWFQKQRDYPEVQKEVVEEEFWDAYAEVL